MVLSSGGKASAAHSSQLSSLGMPVFSFFLLPLEPWKRERLDLGTIPGEEDGEETNCCEFLDFLKDFLGILNPFFEVGLHDPALEDSDDESVNSGSGRRCCSVYTMWEMKEKEE